MSVSGETSTRHSQLSSDGIPAVWECIHQHEQPDWHAPGIYPGGLGIMREATDNYRRQVDPSFPVPDEAASPEQQVRVARWVLGYAGPSAWATAGICGLERGD